MSDLSNLLGNVYSGDADGRSVNHELRADQRMAPTGGPALDTDLADALSAAIVEASAPAPQAQAAYQQPIAPPAMAPQMPAPAMPAPVAPVAPAPVWTAPIPAPVHQTMQNWALGDDDIVPGSESGRPAKRGRK